jgi:predicted DNA-binding protein
MKTITVNVSEPTYRDFQRHAETTDRTTSELIREAMEEYRDRKLRRGGEPFDLAVLFSRADSAWAAQVGRTS